MINSELLAKMLDGTLTDAERTILNNESALHPELANEVAQLQRIDAMLANSGLQYDTPTPAFLKCVEDEIAQRVRDSRSIKPVPFIPPIFDTKFNWNLLIMACSGIVTISSLGYLGYTKLYRTELTTISVIENNSTQQPILSIQSPINTVTQQETSNSNERQNQIITSKGTSTRLSSELTTDNSKQKLITNQLVQQKDYSKNELDAMIAASSGANIQLTDIQNKLNLLNEKRLQGDKFSEMTLNKQIGLLYNLGGNPIEAKKYLEEALKLAQISSIKDEEATILGELGLIDYKLGYPDRATYKIRQAIDILTSVGNNASRWTKELSRLQK